MNQQISIVTPLDDEQKKIVIDETQRYIKQATDLFNLKEKNLDISFDLKGRAAGMYRIKSHKKLMFIHQKKEIRYNPYIFSKYFTDNCATTIPHEVAHYITDRLYGLKNIKPHGKEWKAVMHAFNADPSVTANYDLAGIPLKTQSLFSYQCSCRDHQLSTVRHNKITKRHYRYYCKYCKQSLRHKQPLTEL